MAYDPLSRTTHVRQTTFLAATSATIIATTFNIRINFEGFHLIGEIPDDAGTLIVILGLIYFGYSYASQLYLDYREAGSFAPNIQKILTAKSNIEKLEEIASHLKIASNFAETKEPESTKDELNLVKTKLFEFKSGGLLSEELIAYLDNVRTEISDYAGGDMRLDQVFGFSETTHDGIVTMKERLSKEIYRETRLSDTTLIKFNYYILPSLLLVIAIFGLFGYLSLAWCYFSPSTSHCIAPTP